MIRRDKYLNQLIRKKENGMVKVIVGLRRCGKSFLLFNLFKDHLLNSGVDESHIIAISLDDISNQRYWNPNELDSYLRSRLIPGQKTNYVFIDEIQLVKEVENPYLKGSKVGFTDVVLGLLKIPNVDVYVTGSNSEMLSKDILSKFRGRGDQIHLRPLSFREFYDASDDKAKAWQEYILYGGMPRILSLASYEDKSNYLKNLFSEVYLKDIIDRNDVRNDKGVLDDLLNIVSSSIGSLTNPLKLSHAFQSVRRLSMNPNTIKKYLGYFIDSFLIESAKRYDIRGRQYIGSPLKYYFEDIGLRNARLNFSEIEETHIMENVLYNELRYRGFDVDVGVVDWNYKDEEKKSQRKRLEIDFVCRKGNEKYYIQSAYAIQDAEKKLQETRGFKLINDSFKKILVIKEDIIPRQDENGILCVGIQDFLLDESFTER